MGVSYFIFYARWHNYLFLHQVQEGLLGFGNDIADWLLVLLPALHHLGFSLKNLISLGIASASLKLLHHSHNLSDHCLDALSMQCLGGHHGLARIQAQILSELFFINGLNVPLGLHYEERLVLQAVDELLAGWKLVKVAAV